MRAIAPRRFVCSACGKTSATKYGDSDRDRGWDVSCTLNSVLCRPVDGVPPWFAIDDPIEGIDYEQVP
jgi:hypothetical protein